VKTRVTEIQTDIFQLSTYVEAINLQFNQFLVLDDEPLLYHTGMKSLFPVIKKAVAEVMDVSRLRWISFSHFEADECGALNEWLAVAPQAEPACGMIGALTSVNDFANRPAKILAAGETFTTGKYRYRYIATHQLPHGWDAGMLFEETTRLLFCSDLFHQNGDLEPITSSSLLERYRQTLTEYQTGPFANYLPYTGTTDAQLQELAALKPALILPMHGSVFKGDGEAEINSASAMLAQELTA
jgi:flavorubredoxin